MIQNTDNYTIAWRVWYDSGTEIPNTYNSVEHNLVDLPSDGFQAMRLWYADGTGRYLSGNDYYFFAAHPGGTIFGQSNDTYESIVTRYNEVTIKRGKHVPDGLIQEIHQMMLNSLKP